MLNTYIMIEYIFVLTISQKCATKWFCNMNAIGQSFINQVIDDYTKQVNFRVTLVKFCPILTLVAHFAK